MTGRAAGYCAGYSMPGYMNPYGGRLRGAFGWGRGRWWPYAAGYRPVPTITYPPYPYGQFASGAYGAGSYQPPYSAEQERDLLQNQAKAMEDQLDSVRKRISELEDEMEQGKEEGKKSKK
jgi:hypothetical protein